MRTSPRAGAPGRPLLLLLLLWALPTAAQAPGVRVERRGPDTVAVSPGETATVVFRVVNPGAGTARAETRAELPGGWRLLVGGGGLELAAGAAETRLVGFAVPTGAPAGAYRVRFGASPGGDGSRDSVAVRVREHRRLELRLLEAPELVAAGEPYTSRFLLANRGNVPARVTLHAASGHGFALRADTTPLRLAPGEERALAVVVLTPRALDRAVRHPLELRAVDPDGAGPVSAASRVEVVPLPSPASRFHYLPVAVTLRAASAADGGIPGEVSGSGALLPGGRLRLDFLARGAADPFLGQRPGYRAALSGAGFDLRVGDHLWARSLLAGGMRPGRGVGGSVTAGRWTASGLARRGVAGAPEEAESGASLAFRVGGSARVEAGGFRRSGPGAGEGWTLRASAVPLPWSRLEAEYGRGGDGESSARHLYLHGGGTHVSYSVRHLRVGEGFPWRGGAARQDHAALAVRPAGRLRLDASASRRAGGDGGIPGPFAEGEGWSARAGVAYGTAAAIRFERRGGAEAARDGAAVRSGELRLGLARGPLRLQPVLQVGAAADSAGDGEAPFRRLGLHASLAGRGGSLSARIDRLDGAVPGRPGTRSGTELALDAAARLGEAGALRASVRTARYGAGGWSETFLDAGAERLLPAGHRVAAGVRISRAGSESRTHLRLDYTIPVAVPVGPGGEGGRVTGRVYDAETGAPLAGALVTLAGRTVLTDARGRLSFPGLRPGTYPLRVEARGAGAGRVPVDAAPVVLRPGTRETRVEVAVVRSARLSGVVRLVSGADSAGIPGVVVELARAGEVVRRVSGADGGFDFTDLRPGRWTISAAGDGLPPHHRVESGPLELAPGEEREQAVRVLPVQRPVRMLTRGDVVVEAPRPGAARP